jgi:hypothetical protein
MEVEIKKETRVRFFREVGRDLFVGGCPFIFTGALLLAWESNGSVGLTNADSAFLIGGIVSSVFGAIIYYIPTLLSKII